MKNVPNLEKEIRLISAIERKIGTAKLNQEELNFMLDEARRGVPRQVFNYGLYIYYETFNEEEARRWFDKALKSMNGYGLLRASGKLAELGDAFIDDSMRFLRRAAWRQNPIAKRMLKFMKEHPYQLPQA